LEQLEDVADLYTPPETFFFLHVRTNKEETSTFGPYTHMQHAASVGNVMSELIMNSNLNCIVEKEKFEEGALVQIDIVEHMFNPGTHLWDIELKTFNLATLIFAN
jgi:hypothetical protein